MMEKIRINAITKKPCASGGEIAIVNYQKIVGESVNIPQEATLNTKWQKQEVWYLENEVGIGGEVSVLIVQKGEYTNITKVDMTSAIRGINSDMNYVGRRMEEKKADDQILKEVQQGTRSINGQEQKPVGMVKSTHTTEKFRTPAEMVATELTVAVIEQNHVPYGAPQAAKMYKEILELLG